MISPDSLCMLMLQHPPPASKNLFQHYMSFNPKPLNPKPPPLATTKTKPESRISPWALITLGILMVRAFKGASSARGLH